MARKENDQQMLKEASTLLDSIYSQASDLELEAIMYGFFSLASLFTFRFWLFNFRFSFKFWNLAFSILDFLFRFSIFYFLGPIFSLLFLNVLGVIQSIQGHVTWRFTRELGEQRPPIGPLYCFKCIRNGLKGGDFTVC